MLRSKYTANLPCWERFKNNKLQYVFVIHVLIILTYCSGNLMRKEAAHSYQPEWREGEKKGRMGEFYFWLRAQERGKMSSCTPVDKWRLRREWCLLRSSCFPKGCAPKQSVWSREQKWEWLMRMNLHSFWTRVIWSLGKKLWRTTMETLSTMCSGES